MRMRLMLVLLMAVVAAPAMAQVTPSIEVGLGYAYLRDEGGEGSGDSENLPLGWYADIAGNLSDSLGLVAEVSGSYKTFDSGDGDLKLSFHSLVAGPRLSRRGDGASFYAQVLAGVTRLKVSGGGFDDSTTKFALQPGIGLDFRMSDGLALRIGGDYRLIFFEGEKGKQWRATAGLVFRSGTR
jgi:opacity protein-like surface antigen